MFRVERKKSGLTASLTVMELIYHNTVRSIRKGHRHALIGLLVNIIQTVILVLVFYVMFEVLGLRGNSIRGDFVLFLLSGIFLYITNVKAMSAVIGAEGPTSAMMLHAPMNTAIAIGSAALASLYIQILSVAVVLGVYHMAFTPVEIYDPIGALGMLLLAWLNGTSVGMVVLAIKPWWPSFVAIAQTVYTRVNVFASGKMFVANALSFTLVAMFDWNPLFHIIDQARGYTFINYNPFKTSLDYPIYVTLALLMLGLMGEYYTRKRVSVSWSAGR